jgi:hypothetical protein
MPHRFTSFDARRDFIHSAPRSAGDDPHAELAAWLATADFALGASGAGDTCSVLVLVDEGRSAMRVFAIPDAKIGETMRSDLDRAHGANAELFFTADLAPEQFAGMLWFLSLTDVQGMRSIRDDLESEIPSYDVAVDWPAVDAAWGTWTQYEIGAGASLPGPVSRIYAANHAP